MTYKVMGEIRIFPSISTQEKCYFLIRCGKACFVLDKHAKLDFNKAISQDRK
jgi:hypothetical protein